MKGVVAVVAQVVAVVAQVQSFVVVEEVVGIQGEEQQGETMLMAVHPSHCTLLSVVQLLA